MARQQKDEAKANNLLLSVETDAASLLADAGVWSRLKPHDRVWAPATRGEACLLLGRWPEAEAAYAEAVRAAGADEFPRQSMAKQVRETLIPAFQRLGQRIERELAEPDTFFCIRPNSKGAAHA